MIIPNEYSNIMLTDQQRNFILLQHQLPEKRVGPLTLTFSPSIDEEKRLRQTLENSPAFSLMETGSFARAIMGHRIFWVKDELNHIFQVETDTDCTLCYGVKEQTLPAIEDMTLPFTLLPLPTLSMYSRAIDA